MSQKAQNPDGIQFVIRKVIPGLKAVDLGRGVQRPVVRARIHSLWMARPDVSRY